MSVALPVGTYGIAFGAAAVANGFSVIQASLFSILLFSGASQFAVVGVMGAGGSALSAITTGSLLGFRNGLYSMRMKPVLNVHGFKKLLAAQITIDESTGVAISQEPRGEAAMRYGFWATGIGVFVFWNLFTLLGAFGAQALGNPSAWGLDAAVPAAGPLAASPGLSPCDSDLDSTPLKAMLDKGAAPAAPAQPADPLAESGSFTAYAVDPGAGDPLVKVLHELITHAAEQDRRIAQLCQTIESMGTKVQGQNAALDVQRLNKLVDE